MNQNDHTLILIVDDNPVNCELLHRRLTRQGYQCVIANSGRQMFDIIQTQRPNLVLLDLMMPEMDGHEVLRILRETDSSSDLPVLIVTAKNAREDVVTAFEYGANDYIEKPIDFPILLARLKHQLEHKRLQDESQRARIQLNERKRQWRQAHQQKVDLLVSLSDALVGPTRALQDEASALANHASVSGYGNLLNQARHLQQLAEDLRDMALIESGQLELHFQPADLYVLLSNLLEPLQQQATANGLNLQINLDEQFGIMACDPLRIRQIVTSLIHQAIATAAPQSRAEFSAGLTPAGAIQILLAFTESQPGTRNPFTQFNHPSVEQATKVPESNGLGLVLASKLVALHHGLVDHKRDSSRCELQVLLPYQSAEGPLLSSGKAAPEF